MLESLTMYILLPSCCSVHARATCFRKLYALHELFPKTLMVGLQVWLRGAGDFIVIVLLVAAMRPSMEKMGQQVWLHHTIVSHGFIPNQIQSDQNWKL